jgi:poly(A) polymerase
LRILRFFRFHARFDAGEPDQAALDACSLRANDLMALSRERIADELLKLLEMPEPSSTVEIMLERAILKPILPEIDLSRLGNLKSLIAAERDAGVEPNALRRLAALLPRDGAIADDIGVRLRLSNKARKRLGCAAEQELGSSPQALAYRLGAECAVDRLLLAGRVQEARELSGWHRPRLPISGGQLIKRGLAEGPIVARTLRTIDDRWVEAGFPTGDEFERIVGEELAKAQA